MHIAIDDTYGPVNALATKYVTGARRTYVAVEFPDSQVDEVRENIRGCLKELRPIVGIFFYDFEFSEIYNCSGAWTDHRGLNLKVFEFFAQRYAENRWRVHVQTVDDRTLRGRESEFTGKVDELDLSSREDQALFMLLCKVKWSQSARSGRLVVRADAGRCKPGSLLMPSLFRELGPAYDGRYADSQSEPLIQIADFLAYSINRCTHLMMKRKRTDHDLFFLSLIGSMGIRCQDITFSRLTDDISTGALDALHKEDRRKKGIE